MLLIPFGALNCAMSNDPVPVTSRAWMASVRNDPSKSHAP